MDKRWSHEGRCSTEISHIVNPMMESHSGNSCSISCQTAFWNRSWKLFSLRVGWNSPQTYAASSCICGQISNAVLPASHIRPLINSAATARVNQGSSSIIPCTPSGQGSTSCHHPARCKGRARSCSFCCHREATEAPAGSPAGRWMSVGGRPRALYHRPHSHPSATAFPIPEKCLYSESLPRALNRKKGGVKARKELNSS